MAAIGRRWKTLLRYKWSYGAWVMTAVVTGQIEAQTVDPRIAYTASLAESVGYSVSGIAAGSDGSVWVAGTTTSHTLPVTDDAIDTNFDPNEFDEGYVLKFSPGGELLYATYLGGRNVDDLASIAIDTDGSVFVAGTTLSDDFPVTLDAYQPALASAGTEDAFLVKLDANGGLLYSTYFGGNSRDLFPGGVRGNPGVAVALGPDRSVYLAGGTNSTDLPTSSGYQQSYGGGAQDAFLAKFSPGLLFERCTYLGGNDNEGAYRARVDAAGNVYLMGLATRILGAKWSFPATPGALLTNPSGDVLLFVAKFDAAGALAYATFLGPNEGDPSLGQHQGDLAVDPQGNAYVVAVTGSPNFPTTQGAFQTTLRGFSDLSVSKLDPSGASLQYSTYFGGSAAEYPNNEPGARIAVNDSGQAYIAANTDSLDLPQRASFEPNPTGRFITKLNSSGTGLEFSSYVGFQQFGVEALALSGSEGAAAGDGANIAVYVGGPTAEPRGLAVIGIDEGGGPPPACFGDCNGDGTVRINELVTGVRIVLEEVAATSCPSFDPDGDGRALVSDLVRAVRAVLAGCL